MKKWLPLLTVFAFGVMVGLMIALVLIMRIQMMDWVVPGSPIGWVWL